MEKRVKMLQVSSCGCTTLGETNWAKIRVSFCLWLQDNLKTVYSFKSRLNVCIFPHLFAWILHIWIFLLIVSKCIIHVLHLLCCMLSACLSRRRNFRESQRLQHSQEEWQANSKGFAWIQSFHLGDSCCMKTCCIKHNLSPLQSPQRDPSSSPWRLLAKQESVLGSKLMPTRTCGFAEKHIISGQHLWCFSRWKPLGNF